MSEAALILVIVVATALVFNFTNGFHHAANAIAARALRPRPIVISLAGPGLAAALFRQRMRRGAPMPAH